MQTSYRRLPIHQAGGGLRDVPAGKRKKSIVVVNFNLFTTGMVEFVSRAVAQIPEAYDVASGS